MNLIGKAVCAWKGKHKFGKPVAMPDSLWQAIGSPDPRPRNKVCQRCGLIVPVKARKRKQEPMA